MNPGRFVLVCPLRPDREGLLGQGGDDLPGDPCGRLVAGPAVAERAVGLLERAQVGNGRTAAAAAQALDLPAGGGQGLDDERGGLGVGRLARCEWETTVARLAALEPADGSGRGPALALAGRDERHDDGGGVVDPRLAAAAGQAPPAIAVLLPEEPVDARLRSLAAGAAQGEHRERGAV